MPQHKGGKKNRKLGRNKEKCASYRAKGTREKNRARKAATRLAKFRHPELLDPQGRRKDRRDAADRDGKK